MTLAAGAPSIELPAEAERRDALRRDPAAARLRWGAILAALLVHLLVLLAVILRLPDLFAPPPLPPAIPVTLVMQPPPPPAPKAVPQPAPPAPRQELMSGPDQVTTAPPKPAEKGPEAAPEAQPAAPPALTAPNAVAAIPEPKPKPPEAKPVKPKTAPRLTMPENSRGFIDRAPGENLKAGDPYLNHLWSLIEAHRFYPANAVGPLGLPLEGTSVYLVAIRSDGGLQGIRLERSAGAEALDRTAAKMIQEAAPFPPPPSYFPAPGVVLEVTIHIFPGAS